MPSTIASSLPVDIKLPGWLGNAATDLIGLAERLIPGAQRGPARKRWVKESLRKLLREHDIAAIPNWVEGPAEDMIVDIVVELVFTQLRKKA